MAAKLGFAHQIELFTLSSMPIDAEGFKAEVCILDEVDKFEQQLASLSDDISKIKTFAKYNEKNLIHSFSCQQKASSYSLEKLPAIVIDASYVAYGKLSIESALEKLEAFKGYDNE